MPARAQHWAFGVLSKHRDRCKGATCQKIALDGPIADEVIETLGDRACFPKIRELSLTNSGLLDAQLAKLVSARNMTRLERLTITEGALTSKGAEALATSRNMSNLVKLDLTANALGAKGANALLRSKNLGKLEELSLVDNLLGDAKKTIAFDARVKRSWRSIDLEDNALTKEQLTVLLEAKQLGELQELNLRGSKLDTEGIALLSSAKHLGSIEKLSISCSCEDKEIETLANSPHLSNITHLTLSHINITDVSVFDGLLRTEKAKKLEHLDFGRAVVKGASTLEIISRATELPNLRHLAIAEYRSQGPRETEIQHLFQSGLLKNLDTLVLDSPLTNEHADIIAKSADLSELKTLDISGYNNFDDQTGATILGSPYLGNLEVLRIGGSKEGRATVNALVNNSAINKLRVLDLTNTRLDNPDIITLANAPSLRNLEALAFDNASTSSSGILAIANSPYIRELRELDTSVVISGANELDQLSNSPNFWKLENLSISLIDIPDNSFEALLKSPLWESLERVELMLTFNRKHLDAIADAPGSNNIEELTLWGDLPRDSLVAFSTSANLTRLHSFKPIGFNHTKEDRAFLMDLPLFAQLHTLTLSGFIIEEDGIELLAQNLSPRMRQLTVMNSHATDVNARELAQNAKLYNLRELELLANNFSIVGHKHLADSPHLPARIREKHHKKSIRRIE
jgi:hypothetical protein